MLSTTTIARRTALLVVIAFILATAVTCDQSSTAFGDLFDVKYHESMPPAVRDSMLDMARKEELGSPSGENDGEFVHMKLPNGTRYACFVPSAQTFAEEKLEKGESSKFEAGEPVPTLTMNRINAAMSGVCLSKIGGYWLYEACWDRHLRQYHQKGNNEIETEYFLGKGPHYKVNKGAKRTDLKYGQHSIYGPYVSMTYYNGTTCDLTQKPRTTEMRLYCDMKSDDNSGIEVSEPETCNYLVWMAHPAACVDELKKTEGVVHDLDCYKLPEEQVVADMDAVGLPESEVVGEEAADRVAAEEAATNDDL